MDTEKTETQTTKGRDNSLPEEKKTAKQPIADVVGDLVVSAATVIAHSAAGAVVNRVKKVAKKKAPKNAAAIIAKAKAVAKKVAPKTAKRGKKTKSPAGRKAVGKKETAKNTGKKKMSKKSRR